MNHQSFFDKLINSAADAEGLKLVCIKVTGHEKLGMTDASSSSSLDETDIICYCKNKKISWKEDILEGLMIERQREV